MADFPGSIYDQRALENVPGVSYDSTKTQRIYAEDLQGLGDEITAIEATLGENPNGAFGTVLEWLTSLAAAIAAIAWVVSGSDVYFTGGNVGIGTSSPGTLLDIEGSNPIIRITSTSGTNAAQLAFATPSRLISFGSNDAGGAAGTYGFYDNTAGAWRMVITHPDGFVGIGTETPVAKLDVENGASVLGQNVWVTQNNGGYWLSDYNDFLIGFYRDSGGNAYLRTGYTARIKIQYDGKIGLQGSTGNSPLNVGSLPTSVSGLSSGDVWVDTTGGLNTLKVV